MRHIELSNHGNGDTNAAVMIAKLKGSALTETSDKEEVEAFCKRLEGYTFSSYADLFANPDNTPLPQGYRNVRVHDRRDGSCIGSIWWVGSADTVVQQGHNFRTLTERPRARKIIAMCLFMPFEEVTAWRSTTVAPAGEPGVLDLIVDIDTRPRELLMIDGSPLPADIIDFIASRAPSKAKSRPTSA